MKIAIVKLSALGDIVHAMIVLQFIKKYNQAIVITTHNPNVANIGNKKFKLEKGNLK